MAPAALAGMVRGGPFRRSAETGCGGSTIVLSHASDHHVAFAIEGTDETITQLRKQSDLRTENLTIVEGESKETVPDYRFDCELDLVLLDGPHAYPLPQIEFTYLFPQVKVGGWLVVDDVHIPSVYELVHFLRKESSVVMEEIIVRTAFFRRVSAAEHGPDGWAAQGMNRNTILRYSWRDRLRRVLGKRRSHPPEALD
jgi:precorrin-6B methylase 2